jgi:hypothetical protein
VAPLGISCYDLKLRLDQVHQRRAAVHRIHYEQQLEACESWALRTPFADPFFALLDRDERVQLLNAMASFAKHGNC